MDFDAKTGLWLPPKPAIIRRWAKDDAKLAVLPGMVPVIGGKRPPIVFEWITSAEVANLAAATWNVGTVSIGSASADRKVVLLIGAQGQGGNSRTINSASIGGSAATMHTASGSTPYPTAIAYRAIASGTTANVTIVFSANVTRIVVGVAVVRDTMNDTPQTAATPTAGTSTSRSLGLTIPSGGIGLWAVSQGTSGNTTWTNADEQLDISPATGMVFSAAKKLSDAGGSVTATASFTSSVSNSMCATAWR